MLWMSSTQASTPRPPPSSSTRRFSTPCSLLSRTPARARIQQRNERKKETTNETTNDTLPPNTRSRARPPPHRRRLPLVTAPASASASSVVPSQSVSEDDARRHRREHRQSVPSPRRHSVSPVVVNVNVGVTIRSDAFVVCRPRATSRVATPPIALLSKSTAIKNRIQAKKWL